MTILANSFMSGRNLFDLLAFIAIPTFVMIANVWIVNRNTNKQIANQNKETYRPRLKLNDFYRSRNDSRTPDYMTSALSAVENGHDKSIYAKLELKNIGNGVANDITFYNLLKGENVCNARSVESHIDQRSFGTDEIEKDGIGSFKFMIAVNEGVKISRFGDVCLTLCNYKDLSGNNYRLIIGLRIKIPDSEYAGQNKYSQSKKQPAFDIFYYQENTEGYGSIITECKKSYKEIIKHINKPQLKLKVK